MRIRVSFLVALLHRLVRRRRPRAILLVAQNRLMATYLNEVRNVLADDANLSFHLTVAPVYISQAEGRALAADLGLPYVTYWWSRRMWWDLLIVADHHVAHRWHPGIPRLRLQHGLMSAKTFGSDEPYVYARRHNLRDGRAVYTRILESSESRRNLMVRRFPELDGRVAVVGSLRADALLERSASRDAIRRDQGFEPTDRVVVLASTHGKESLLETMGTELLREAEALMRRSAWRFTVAAHPLMWSESSWEPRLRELAARGFGVVEPNGNWIDALVAADVMVVDHTALLAFFALLGRPIIPVPVPDHEIEPDNPIQRIRSLVPPLEEPSRLEAALEEAWTRYPHEKLSALAREIVTYPGEARSRVRAEFYRVLGANGA
jgi:hypothetical protein